MMEEEEPLPCLILILQSRSVYTEQTHLVDCTIIPYCTPYPACTGALFVWVRYGTWRLYLRHEAAARTGTPFSGALSP